MSYHINNLKLKGNGLTEPFQVMAPNKQVIYETGVEHDAVQYMKNNREWI